MKIGDLARKTGISIATLRFYESEGLLECRRSKTGYRHFSEETVQVVQKIVYLRSFNLPLAEIRLFLHKSEPGREHSEADQELQLQQLSERLSRIQEQKELLLQMEIEVKRQIGQIRPESLNF